MVICPILLSMDLSHPLRMITPTLEGDILSLLSKADREYTGREVQRLIGATQDAVRFALQRLGEQGLVDARPAGRAIMFSLNRDHLAAPHIEALAALRLELLDRLRGMLSEWQVQPLAAVLFGSAARNEAGKESDLDLLLIRPRKVDADDETWQEQLSELSERATRWTGNDTRILEYSEDELMELAGQEPVLDAAANEGLDLSDRPFRRLWLKAKKA
jgi:predicted nucleotidyltransferase